MNMKAAIVAILAVLAVVCALPAADALSISGNPDTVEFDNMNGGTISFDVINNSTGDSKITVTVTENGNKVFEDEYDVAVATEDGPSTTTIDVVMGDFTVTGNHNLTVTCTPADSFDVGQNSFNVNVVVTENILSSWTTYVVIAIAIIVVAILVYLKMRDTPKEKNTMTFEELEAQRKAEAAQKSEMKANKKASGTSTERKRYTGRKKE